MSEILFSVVIACYNQVAFIRDSVDSALSQACSRKEIIVVDDASSDGTAEVLDKFGDAIIVAKLAQNGGVAAARNHGASLARGEYVVFLDGDDVLMPWALQVYSHLIAARQPRLIMAQAQIFNGPIPSTSGYCPRDVHFVEYSDFLAKDRKWLYNTSALVVKRDALISSGGWTPGIFYQDIQDLLNKLAVAGKALLVVEPDTVWYRMHSTNAVRKVLPFVSGIYVLLAKAKTGAYPGSPKDRLRRSAWFGGLIFYWMKEAIRAGHYRQGLVLLATKWWMVLLAMIRRGTALILGRKPIEILRLEQS